MSSPKDAWDKIETISKFIMPLAVIFLTFQIQNWLSDREKEERRISIEREEKRRETAREAQRLASAEELLAQITASREEADSALRKDMFSEILRSFVVESNNDLRNIVLNLELLTKNFHENIDLRPLFKIIVGKLREQETNCHDYYLHANCFENKDSLSESEQQKLLDRVLSLSEDIRSKELSVLMTGRNKYANYKDGILFFENDKLPVGVEEFSIGEKLFKIHFSDHDPENFGVHYSISIKFKDGEILQKREYVDPFVFPMLQNIRLKNGERAALVIKEMGPYSTSDGRSQIYYKFIMIVFPGSRASQRDRPYFDELMRDILSVDKSLKSTEDLRND